MGKRNPTSSKQVRTRSRKRVKVVSTYVPARRRSIIKKEKECERKREDRLKWNDEQIERNRELSRIRMQRKRKADSVLIVPDHGRKPYVRTQSFINLSEQESKAIKAQQKREQRRFKKLKLESKTEEFTYEDFLIQEDSKVEDATEVEQVARNGEENQEEIPVVVKKSKRTIRRIKAKVKKTLKTLNQEDTSLILDQSTETLNINAHNEVFTKTISEFVKPTRKRSKEQTELLRHAVKHAKAMQLSHNKLSKLIHVSRDRLKRISQKKPDKRGGKFLPTTVITEIKDLYLLHSRALPVKRRGKKRPTRILEKTLRQLYKLFLTQQTRRVSFATFAAYRPKYIRTTTLKDFLVCLCEKCLNCKLKIEALIRSSTRLGKKYQKLVKVYTNFQI